jgi:hypothetical protein
LWSAGLGESGRGRWLCFGDARSIPRIGEQGAFETPDGKVTVTRLWSAGLGESGRGRWLYGAAQTWWYTGVKRLIHIGVVGIWNDSNEYELSSDANLCSGNDTGRTWKKKTEGKDLGAWLTPISWGLSRKALSDSLPGIRILSLTRSATAGTMRYANSSGAATTGPHGTHYLVTTQWD